VLETSFRTSAGALARLASAGSRAA
jgi:hypothetical protein